MKILFTLLSLFALLLTGCQVAGGKDDSTAAVELSSEVEPGPLPLEASFMSTHQTFAYILNYDGNAMEMRDEALNNTGTSFGPNFLVEGGTEITGYTVWASEADKVPEVAAAELYGHYQVYRYSVPDGICTIDKAVIPHLQESLMLQMRTCPDQDATAAKETFESLLDGLHIKDL